MIDTFSDDEMNKSMEETRADGLFNIKKITLDITKHITIYHTYQHSECIGPVYINGSSYILGKTTGYDDDMRRITRCAHFFYEKIHHTLQSWSFADK